MRILKAIWDNIYGLFVDDQTIAAGTVAALIMTGLWIAATGGNEALHELGGLVLFLLLMATLLVNLYFAGRRAARTRVEG